MTGPVVAAVFAEVLAEWRRDGYLPPAWLSAPGWSTAHLPRVPGHPRPLTVCGRVIDRPFPVGASFARCHYCATVGPPAAGDGLSGPQTPAEAGGSGR